MISKNIILSAYSLSAECLEWLGRILAWQWRVSETGIKKIEIRQADNIPSSREAWNATFWLTTGFKKRLVKSFGFSTEGTLISASTATHHRSEQQHEHSEPWFLHPQQPITGVNSNMNILDIRTYLGLEMEVKRNTDISKFGTSGLTWGLKMKWGVKSR